METPRRHEASELEAWLRVAPWPMHLVNTDGEVYGANPEMAHLLGFSETDLTRQRLQDCISEQSHKRLRDELGRLHDRGMPNFTELSVTFRHRDGAEIVARRTRVGPLNRRPGPLVVMPTEIIFADGMNRADAQGKLCRLVTHDLNNAFTIAKSYVDLTRRQKPRPEQVDDYLSRASRALKRAIDVASHLSIIALEQPMPFEECDLSDTITSLRPFIPRLMAPGPQWTIQCEPDLPPLLCRPVGLMRLLLDLCINAHLRWGHSAVLHLKARRARRKNDALLIRITPDSSAAPPLSTSFRLYFVRADLATRLATDPLFVQGILENHPVSIDLSDDGMTALLPLDHSE